MAPGGQLLQSALSAPAQYLFCSQEQLLCQGCLLFVVLGGWWLEMLHSTTGYGQLGTHSNIDPMMYRHTHEHNGEKEEEEKDEERERGRERDR